MKKILILGCSYTLGSYGLSQYSNEHRKGLDALINNIGWWYFVDYFKNNNVTVIAFPAQGYWAYYQILLYLKEQNVLEYDEIWIQETLELRATINNYKEISSLFPLQKGHIINETFKLFSIDNTKILTLGKSFGSGGNSSKKEKKEHEPYSLWYSFFDEITKLCARNIDNLCAEKNIKGYVWSMYDSIMQCNHFTRLPLTFIRQELKNNNLLVPGDHLWLHQTEEGNKYIGKLINETLCIDTKI